MTTTSPSDRLDWTIRPVSTGWMASSIIAGTVLFARTKAELMSKINKWDKENSPDSL